MATIKKIQLPDGSVHDIGGGGTVDQVFDGDSANAQSGVALAPVFQSLQNMIPAQGNINITASSGWGITVYANYYIGNLGILCIRVMANSSQTVTRSSPGTQVGRITGYGLPTTNTETVVNGYDNNNAVYENFSLTFQSGGAVYLQCRTSGSVTIPQYGRFFATVAYIIA